MASGRMESSNRLADIERALNVNDFKTAILLLIHADRASDQFQKNLEYFFYQFSYPYFSGEEQIKYKKLILPLISYIEPIKTTQAQLVRYGLLLLANSFTSHPDKSIGYKLANEACRLILNAKEPVLSRPLAWGFFNIGIGLENETKLESLVYEVALQLMPNTESEIEHLFLNVIITQLTLNQSKTLIQKLSQRTLTILDAKDEVKLIGIHKHNHEYWLRDVIYPLMKDPTREMCEATIIFLRLVLKIAPNKTLEDKNFILKLYFIQAQNYLKLGHHEKASQLFSQCKLEKSQCLSSDAIDELIIVTAEFAKNKDFDALLHASAFVPHEKFVERFKALILRGNFWEKVLPLLEALHAKGFRETIQPNILISGIPFIIHVAKANQYDILKFWTEKTSAMSVSLLTASVSVEAGDTQNCTALYFVGVGGDFIVFRYLLERIPALYYPEITADHTKPFIHALLENAAKDFSTFSQYYKILELLVNKFPDEMNKIWKGETITDLLNRLHPSIKICLGAALHPREIKMQAGLESQIRKEIVMNAVLKPFLCGAEILSEKCFYKDCPERPPVEALDVLRENLEMLDSLINPYSGTGWLRVSVAFYNTEFLPWKLKCESDADCYGAEGLPTVKVRDSIHIIKEINTIINLVHGYFTRSVTTPLLKASRPRELVFHNETVTRTLEEKKDESPVKYIDTMHPASSSFLKMFKDRKEVKGESVKEEPLGSLIHPAYR